jgi:NAD(P)-dependent dehydrogenase (short-subunit alcohol dehydrogenase family)
MSKRAGVQGKVVMITGASQGLGAALANAFGAAGAKLSICSRTKSDIVDVGRRVSTLGASCLAQAVDLRDEKAVRNWVERTAAELGTPDVVINNASVLGPRLPLIDYPLDEWRPVVESNLDGAFFVTRSVLPAMTRRGRGSIINVSSGAALPPRPNWGAYAVSKAALEALSLNLAAELAGTGVRVNIVDPGAMRTSMRAAAYPHEDPVRLKEPGSISSLFLWLASDESAAVTGQRFSASEWLKTHGESSP